jgi:FkbM family methyltransferase
VRFGESALTRAVSTLERDVEDTIIGHLHSGGVFYDVGANIGWYSMLAARAVGPDGRVLAFEPSVLNAAFIQQNAAVNHFANVSVICAALTDQEGWMSFLDKGNMQSRLDKDDFDAQAQRRARKDQKIKGQRPVPATTLDSWLAQTGQPPPSLVKIDVEGGELGALRGMTQTLRQSGPTLVIELHNTAAVVADFLDTVDYRHAPIEVDVPTRQAPGQAHVLAQPADTPADAPAGAGTGAAAP